jgi:hypothetical protein
MAAVRERSTRHVATKTQIDDVVTLTTINEVELPAEAVHAAASDFTERRELIFPAVSTRHLAVHSHGTTTADVTEGTRLGPFVLWERCTYDWSRPGVVTATVTDSNVYAVPRSVWTLEAIPTERGCRVEMRWERRFRRRGLGRFMGVVYRRVGPRSFGKYARDILANLERAERDAASPPERSS